MTSRRKAACSSVQANSKSEPLPKPKLRAANLSWYLRRKTLRYTHADGDSCRYSDHRAVVGDIGNDQAVSGDHHVASNSGIANHFRTWTKINVVTDPLCAARNQHTHPDRAILSDSRRPDTRRIGTMNQQPGSDFSLTANMTCRPQFHPALKHKCDHIQDLLNDWHTKFVYPMRKPIGNHGPDGQREQHADVLKEDEPSPSRLFDHAPSIPSDPRKINAQVIKHVSPSHFAFSLPIMGEADSRPDPGKEVLGKTARQARFDRGSYSLTKTSNRSRAKSLHSAGKTFGTRPGDRDSANGSPKRPDSF